jgi:methylmalonyl-CoA mutase N-terminal domain/subunit
VTEPATPSGIPIDRLYSADSAGSEDAGTFPFTRGIHRDMYRSRLWTMRQYAGFGNAAATNERFRQLLTAGQTGLSVAFDLPTQMGFDSDAPLAEGEVGRSGVAIDSVDDLAAVFDQIPLNEVSTSMTINSSAAVLLAMYVVVAEERGIDRTALRGTIQNDVLKEYIARGTYIYPLDPSLRLITDIFQFVADEKMRFNPISVSGYHMREAGATAIQEVAFTLANGLEYLERAKLRGLDIEALAGQMSFFFAAHNDLFEEASKFRAARALWAELVRARFNVSEKAARLRFHTQTGGSMLTAQQPLNNVVRVTVQALAAVLGGTQSLHTNGYDEAISLPTEDAAKLALRTQQVIAHESGVAKTVDPLGGSHYVEALTETIKTAATELIQRVTEMGGAAKGVDEGFFQDEIARSAYAQQRSVENEDQFVVGVNRFVEDESPVDLPTPDFSELARDQCDRLASVRNSRDSERWEGTINRLKSQAAGEEPLMPAIVECVRARATVGEICDSLREIWGTFRHPA